MKHKQKEGRRVREIKTLKREKGKPQENRNGKREKQRIEKREGKKKERKKERLCIMTE